MQISSEILEFCVLSCLLKDDLYGYSITQKIQEKINISESTLYPVLRRLLSQNYLTTYDINFQGRNRRYYKITELGKEWQAKQYLEWLEFQNSVNSIIKENNND